MLKKLQSRIVNIHIPKTAGSSFRRQLSRHTMVIGVDKGGSGEDTYTILSNSARSKLDELRQDGLQFMSGHYRLRDILAVLDGFEHDVSLVTFVREPIRRVLSDYYYSSSDVHTSQAAFVSSFATLESYLADFGHMNKQFKYLAPHEHASVAETFENLKENFGFVGLTEHFDTQINSFLGSIGLEAGESIHHNVSKRHDEIDTAYARYKDQIADLHADDIELYNRIKKEWGLA